MNEANETKCLTQFSANWKAINRFANETPAFHSSKALQSDD